MSASSPTLADIEVRTCAHGKDSPLDCRHCLINLLVLAEEP